MKMLLIDSDEKNRINWQKWWVKCGFLCEIAPDFKSAILKIDSHSYDVILLFLHLSKVSLDGLYISLYSIKKS